MQYIFNRVCSIYSFFRGMYWLFADIHLVLYYDASNFVEENK